MFRKELLFSGLFCFALAGCDANLPLGQAEIGSTAVAEPGNQQLAQAGCLGMDQSSGALLPCLVETPLLGKTVQGLPSLDQQSEPTPQAHSPVYVTAIFTPISATAAPDYDGTFSLTGAADYLSPGVARSIKGPDAALKVATGWTGEQRILYYSIETNTSAHGISLEDFSGTKVLPAADDKVDTAVSIVDGAVPLGGQYYDVQLTATIPSNLIANLQKPLPSVGLPEFPSEEPAPVSTENSSALGE